LRSLTTKAVDNSRHWQALHNLWSPGTVQMRWVITFAERKWSSSILKQEQIRSAQDGKGWRVISQAGLQAPRGKNIALGSRFHSSSCTVCLEYELFYANESSFIISGKWCQRRDCCRMKPFYKNCLFGGVFVFSFCTKIISGWWFTFNLHVRHKCR
jgi:hypothetical protein